MAAHEGHYQGVAIDLLTELAGVDDSSLTCSEKTTPLNLQQPLKLR